ncbi:DUF1788 domain-containing protein [Clostridium perfringens]|uniref:DUF1788 domain-containing protein n=1 Tax=Clostridium perfringens TaxID=1502 RepID=UPI000DA3A1F4|nr:DUF1788 domain-containing protein [Clostridium perfringens]EHK2427622.1 DUF1788 domain-containing protein [Clostridium perfringens]MBO3394525.1 DUF1788 domain-containing protein [Clostridium perfringens]MBO3401327.1 DUF1788 domain-containing protein [Clostridium perfringens]MCX0364076.1 DUF1788 domain-containing protein [Clostridium perfringens]MDH2462148.1 DUF1788 domain-containing protein [Clostridium perfringens]
MSLSDRFNEVESKLKQEKFLKGRGTGNDLSFYIFDYNPKDEIEVRYHINKLIKNFNRLNPNKIKEFDLYKMFIEFLKEQDIFEQIKEMEVQDGKEYTFNAITPFISEDMYINKIADEFNNYEIIFITGVGKVYPFMRAHYILNKLHAVINKKPLLMFYPGQYNGQDLKLFNRFMDDNYYRAFPIID